MERGPLHTRQAQHEAASSRRAGFDPQLAALGLSRGARKRQTKARPWAPLPQPFEATKDPLTIGRWDARPSVGHLEP